MTYKELTPEQKIAYQEYCERKYGKTIVKSEYGEPLYFASDGKRIDTSMNIALLFTNSKN